MINFKDIQLDQLTEFTTVQLINEALSNGFKELPLITSKQLEQLSASKRSFYTKLFEHKSNLDQYFTNPMLFKQSQDQLFYSIYNEANVFTKTEQLFFEFLLGLCRFEFCLAIILYFIEYICLNYDITLASIGDTIDKSYYQSNPLFWKSLHEKSAYVINAMSQLFQIPNDFYATHFWKMAEAFFNNHPHFKQLAQYLVSMQHIPNDLDMLGLAQSLHWGGFGGNGEYLKAFKELQPLLPHCIGYHGKESGGFNSRLEIIFKQQMQMKRTLASLLPNLLTTCFKQHNTTIKLLDVGSGPTYLGAKPIIDKLLEQGKHIDMTVSEVDETSLFKLLQEQQNNTNISAVKFFDLSQIKTIPSQFILRNQYNIVTASLVLHQLTTQQINEALKFFTNITQVGGLIINPDVGESGGFYQCLVNPSNEIDREGYITDYTKHSFFKTAVILENKVKIAYPLRQYSHGFPSAEFALYTIEIFLIIEIDLAALPTLENLWQKGSYTEADRLVQPFTAFNLVSNIKP